MGSCCCAGFDEQVAAFGSDELQGELQGWREKIAGREL